MLADFQVTIPELGTVKAAHPPIVVITSNRTREIHDALKRRCLYHWVGYPNAERELAIVRAKVPGIAKRLSQRGRAFRAGAAPAGPLQVARRRRDARLGDRADRARRGRARSGDGVGHARRAAQVPGRHRAHRGLEGEGAASTACAPSCGRRSDGGGRGRGKRRPAGREPRPARREHRVFRPRAACGRHSGRAGRGARRARSGRCRGRRQPRGLLLDAARRVREEARAHAAVRPGVQDILPQARAVSTS